MILTTFISFYSAIQIQETSCVLKKCWLITFACSCAVDVAVVVKHMSPGTILGVYFIIRDGPLEK